MLKINMTEKQVAKLVLGAFVLNQAAWIKITHDITKDLILVSEKGRQAGEVINILTKHMCREDLNRAAEELEVYLDFRDIVAGINKS